jgi:hypothetical protein
VPENILVFIPDVFSAIGDRAIALRLVPEKKTGSIFITCCQPVVACCKEINTLGICHPCGTCKLSESKLNMTLITGALLALTRWIDIFKQASVYSSMEEMIDGIIEHCPIIGEDSYSKNGMYYCPVPVSVSLRVKVAQKRVIDRHQHPGEGVGILLFPTRSGIPQYLSSIA